MNLALVGRPVGRLNRSSMIDVDTRPVDDSWWFKYQRSCIQMAIETKKSITRLAKKPTSRRICKK